MPKNELDAEEVLSETIDAIVTALTSTTKVVMIAGFKKFMETDHIREVFAQGLMPYVYAAGFLSFAGREITEDNLTKAINSIGMTPNPAHIEALLKTGITSHLMYIYAYYYLLAVGQEPTITRIINVTKEFGIPPNADRAGEALVYIKNAK